MTEKEFLVIFNKFFDELPKREGKDPKGAFCAYCDYLKYVRNNKMTVADYVRKNKIPMFGYGKGTHLFPMVKATFFPRISALCKGEEFIDFVPSWKCEEEPLEIIPPKREQPGFAEFMASVMIDMKEIKLLISDLINTQKNHRSLAGATHEITKKLLAAVEKGESHDQV